MDFEREYAEACKAVLELIKHHDDILACGILAGCLWRTYAASQWHREEEEFATVLNDLLQATFDRAMSHRLEARETMH